MQNADSKGGVQGNDGVQRCGGAAEDTAGEGAGGRHEISNGLVAAAAEEGGFSWEVFRKGLHWNQEGFQRALAPHMQSLSDVVCIISDTYLSWTQDVADQLGIPRLAVWVSAAAEFQVYFHAQELIKAGKLPFKGPVGGRERGIDILIPNLLGKSPVYHRTDGVCEEEEEIKIKGLPGLNRRDFPLFLQIEDSSDEFFYWFIDHIRTGLQASMLLFNSFHALEGTVLDAMRSHGIPAHLIGPLFLLEDLVLNEHMAATDKGGEEVDQVQSGEEYPECLAWLDLQKPRSVVYVAFGTLIHLTKAQVRELALGLLSSGQPFIWVYPSKSEDEGGTPELPQGFLHQVKDRGIVLEWAPQRRILNHPSIGGFLSHCGWNSTMETICSGVPALGLPFLGDQSLHCKLMVDEWKVGLRLERSPDEGIALAEEISRLIQELLAGEKGKQLLERAQELKIAAKSSIQPGGASHLTLDAIIKLVK